MQYNSSALGKYRNFCVSSIGILAGAAFASPAMAQDEPADGFTGFRLEAITGLENAGIDFDDDFHDGGKQSQTGWLYGAAIGYDFRIGRTVTLGVEGDLSDSTAGRQDSVQGTAGDGDPFTGTVNSDSGGDFYIGTRLGFVVAPGALIYGRGGYTHTVIDTDGNGTKGGVPFNFDDDIEVDGFRLGAGAEIKFNPMIYGKIEYNYSNYTDGNIDVGSVDNDLNSIFQNIDIVKHRVVAGVGVRF